MGSPQLVSKIKYKMFQYSYLNFVYFNGEKSHLEFRFIKIVCLVDLKYTLENQFHYPYNQRVVKLYYRSYSINIKGNMQFNKFKLKMSKDLTVM